jgi:ribosomal protein L11 methyltransferase
MLELAPEGFEEVERERTLDLFAYTDVRGAARMRAAFGDTVRVPVEEGWEEQWKTFHRGIRIGELWVGPPWEEPPADAIAVTLDPGRAFGTGAHETTRLCLELLLELERGSLLDVGCGSGVLSIAAAKIGFAPVLALDNDPVAVEVTRRNASENGVEVDARVVDALVDELPGAAVAVANLSAAAVAAVAPRLDVGRLVTSGYLVDDAPDVAPFRRLERRTAGRWAADLHARE